MRKRMPQTWSPHKRGLKMTRRHVLYSGMMMTALGLFIMFPNLVHADEKSEICTASWYGPGLQGSTMKNGERFDMNDPTTIAHSTLPMGTKVKITNLENDKWVIVEVKDRGPNRVAGRCVDASKAVAKDLGFYCGPRCGTARVEVTVLRFP